MAHNEGSILPTRGAPPSQRMEPPTPPRVQQASSGGQPSTSEYSLSFEGGSVLSMPPDEASSATTTTTTTTKDGGGGGGVAHDPYVALSASKVPNQKTVANVGSLPLGALVSPFAEDGSGSVVLRRDPARCARCLAFISGFCKVDGRDGSWTCCFCGDDNSDALLAVGAGGDLSSYPELVMSSVDYHLTSALGAASSYAGNNTGNGGEDGESEPTPVVFLVDECLDDDEVAALRVSMLEVVRALPGSTKVGIATYAASVAVYDLSVTSGMASAEVVPGTRSPTPSDLHSLLYGEGTFLAPLSSCMAAVEAVIGSLRPAASAAGPAHCRPRCLGPALETAAALLKRGEGVPGAEGSSGGGGGGGGGGNSGGGGGSMEVGGGRVLVCMGGPATRGPGGIAVDEESELYDFEEQAAKMYIDELSTTVAALAVSVDILVGGRAAVGAMRLAPLANASGGAILLLEDFGEPFVSNVSAAVRRSGSSAGHGALLSVRASPGVACTRVIGAAEAMASDAAAAATAPSLPALTGDGEINLPVEDTSDVFRLKSTDPSQNTEVLRQIASLDLKLNPLPRAKLAHGVAVFLEYTEDLPADFVHVQFVLWFATSAGARVARCMTRRLPTTGSQRAYLRAVDGSVAAILAAKKAALDAQSPSVGPLEAVDRVEARMLDVAEVFSPTPEDAEATLLHAFPEELSSFAEAMYHMLRGPMLGRMLGHEDERAVARAHFLTAGSGVADCMLVPRLYVWRGGQDFEPIPPADLALRDADALFLDHGTTMFGWIGYGVAADQAKAGEARSAAEAFGKKLARGRFPVPQIKVFNQGSSPARYMVSRLVPLHRDAPHEQDARFPPIRLLSPNERKALMDTFLPTEEPSFILWMRELGLAAPAMDASVKLFMEGG